MLVPYIFTECMEPFSYVIICYNINENWSDAENDFSFTNSDDTLCTTVRPRQKFSYHQLMQPHATAHY